MKYNDEVGQKKWQYFGLHFSSAFFPFSPKLAVSKHCCRYLMVSKWFDIDVLPFSLALMLIFWLFLLGKCLATLKNWAFFQYSGHTC